MEIEIKNNNVGSEIRPVLPECYRCNRRFDRINNPCIVDMMIDSLFNRMREASKFEDGLSLAPLIRLIRDDHEDSDRTILARAPRFSRSKDSGSRTSKCISKVSDDKNIETTHKDFAQDLAWKKIVFKRNAVDAIIKIHDNFMTYVDSGYCELSKRRSDKKRRSNNGKYGVSNSPLQSASRDVGVKSGS